MLPGAEHTFLGLNTLVDVSICRNFLRIDNTNSIAELTRFLNFFRARWVLINYLFSIVYVYFCQIRQTLLTARFWCEIRSFSSPESAFFSVRRMVSKIACNLAYHFAQRPAARAPNEINLLLDKGGRNNRCIGCLRHPYHL
jgi:hypothetical protein